MILMTTKNKKKKKKPKVIHKLKVKFKKYRVKLFVRENWANAPGAIPSNFISQSYIELQNQVMYIEWFGIIVESTTLIVEF